MKKNLFFLFVLLCGPAAVAQINVTPNVDRLGKYEIYELTITHDDAPYGNVWEDVVVESTFTTPANRKMFIGGFYCDTDTWKVRVNAVEEGSWLWTLTLRNATSRFSAGGNFTVTASTNHGFVRFAGNEILYDDGTEINPFGYNLCLEADKLDPAPRWGWYTDETGGLPADLFIGAHADAGFNLFRQSINNCAFNLWTAIDPAGNVYNIKESKTTEELGIKFHGYGYVHWLTIFGFDNGIPFAGGYANAAQMDAIKRYVKYCVDRYGAVTDLWEICNEASPPVEWLDIVGPYLKSIDPYRHPMSVSWEKPNLSYIDWDATHLYFPDQNSKLAGAVISLVDRNRQYNKPALFGEYGNGGGFGCYGPNRFRVQTWSTFYKKGGAAWWHWSGKCPPCGTTACGMYIGTEERAMLKVFRAITGNIPFSMSETPVDASLGCTAIGRDDGARYSAYIVNNSNEWDSCLKNATLTLERFTGLNKAVWVCPGNGMIIKTQEFGPGRTVLDIPPFIEDIALFVNMGQPSPRITGSSANQNTVCLAFNEELAVTDALDMDNYTLESPAGTPVSLGNATFCYTKKGVSIGGISLTAGNSYRVTARYLKGIFSGMILQNGIDNVASGTVNSGQGYTVSGYIKDAANKGIGGIVVSVAGNKPGTYGSFITRSDGYYAVNGLNGNGTNFLQVPAKKDWSFTPQRAQYTSITNNPVQNFTGSFTGQGVLGVSGYVRDAGNNPVKGIAVNLTGDDFLTDVTDSSGYYMFGHLKNGGYYRVAPQKPGRIFSPAENIYAQLDVDQAGQDFIVDSIAGTKLVLTASPATIDANGVNMSTITAAVCDSQGNLAVNSQATVTFSLTAGPGALAGQPAAQALNGKANIMYRSGLTNGTAAVSAVSAGLAPGAVNIVSIANSAPTEPTGLLCAGQSNPANCAELLPDLSWTFNDPNTGDGDSQSAYRLLVADSLAGINANTGNAWDTGKVYSSTGNVKYNGIFLQPGGSYWWKAQTWDAFGAASPFSQAGSFRLNGGLQVEAALKFDSIDDNIEFANNPALDINGGNANGFTLELWLKRDESSKKTLLFYRMNWGAGGYAIGIDGNNYVYMQIGSGGDLLMTENSCQVLAGSWHHIACQVDKGTGTGKIFIDGIERASGALAMPGTWNDLAWVGGAGGTVDELRISNIARYTGNFTVQSSPFVTDSNTKGLWHFNEGTGTTVNDASGNNVSGILKNGPQWVQGYFARSEPSIMIISPNGGETWFTGSPNTVTWKNARVSGNVNIDLSADSGANWARLASNVLNSGSAQVSVSSNALSAACRIRVQETSGAPSGMSAGNFTIAPDKPTLWMSTMTIEAGAVGPGKAVNRSFDISNAGAGTLTGTITSDVSWVTADLKSFSLASQEKQTVTVTIDITGVITKKGLCLAHLTITPAAGAAQTVTITIDATCVLVKPNPFRLSSPLEGEGKGEGCITFYGDGIVLGQTTIIIYTLSGTVVADLSAPDNATAPINGQLQNEITWQPTNLSPGIYIYVYESPKEKGVAKFTVTK